MVMGAGDGDGSSRRRLLFVVWSPFVSTRSVLARGRQTGYVASASVLKRDFCNFFYCFS